VILMVSIDPSEMRPTREPRWNTTRDGPGGNEMNAHQRLLDLRRADGAVLVMAYRGDW
jgi:hypothetical protein